MPTWLLRYWLFYKALRFGTPMRHLRDHDQTTAEKRAPARHLCAYGPEGEYRRSTCAHDAPRYVDPGKVTKAPIASFHGVDPMLGRQIAVDLDRAYGKMSGTPQRLFHLMFHQDKQIAEAAHALGLTMRDASYMLVYHLRLQAADLSDWAPEHAQTAQAA